MRSESHTECYDRDRTNNNTDHHRQLRKEKSTRSNTAVKRTSEQSSATGEGVESGACDLNRIQSGVIVIAPTTTQIITGDYER